MRLLPFLTAVLVAAVLYVVVMERDALMVFARGEGLDAALETARADDSDAAPQRDSGAMSAAAAEAQGSDADAAATADASPTAEAAPAVDTEAERRPVGVVAVHSTAREIDTAVILRGQTEAARQVELRAETSGRVISDPLRKGALVEEGDLLCKLDPGTRASTLAEAQARLAEARASVPSAEANVEQARAALEEANINDNAAKKLSQSGYASDTRVASTRAAVRAAEAGLANAQSGLESASAAIQSAEAAVASAEQEIAKLEITAPFGGLLESDTAEIGSLLQNGGLCATVIQLQPIKLVGFIPETEVARVETGARAGARLAASGEEVTGTVTFLSRSADPQTRTFRVEVEVPNEDLHIRDGQTAEIAVESDGAMAHLLPQSALTLNDDGALGVRTVENGDTAGFVPVKLMRDTTNGVWLTGLPERADVIVVGQEFVVEGVKVAPNFKDPS